MEHQPHYNIWLLLAAVLVDLMDQILAAVLEVVVLVDY
jgi:hypothetical protein